MSRQQIAVTNDDGIESQGLHALAKELSRVGDVTVIAPDPGFARSQLSTDETADFDPEVRKVTIEGIPEAWAVNGPPSLCAMLARLGAFGPQPDIFVSGINTEGDRRRPLYHPAAIGAAITAVSATSPARNANPNTMSCLTISQSIADDGSRSGILWETSATVAKGLVEAMLADPIAEQRVLNVNVPNLPLEKLKGWHWATEVQHQGRGPSGALLEPTNGDDPDTFRVKLSWSDQDGLDSSSEPALEDHISATWLSRIETLQLPAPSLDEALAQLLDRS